MNKRSVVKILCLCIVFFAIGGGVAYGINYYNSFSYVTIDSKVDENIDIFPTTSTDGDSGYEYNKQATPIATVTKTETIKLKKAAYVLIIHDTNGEYANTQTDIFPRTKDFNVTVDSVFTNKKLSELLPNELAGIESAISSQVYNLSGAGYKIEATTLYQKGQWAGALLVPSNKTQDVYRVVLEKKPDGWQVITDPPQINIGAPTYPDIPTDVISSVDNFLKPD